MKTVEANITTFLSSGFCALLLTLIAMAMLWSGLSLTEPPAAISTLIGPTAPLASSSSFTAIVFATAVIVVASGIMMLTNRIFNILRTSSKLFVGIFALAVAATPGAAGLSAAGITLCLVMLTSLMIMYTTYQRTSSNRRIFLVFAIITACSCLDGAFAFYLPVMFIGCAQMRCLSFCGFLAAVIGIVTPLWILWGFSVISLADIMLPRISLPSAATFASYSLAQHTAIATMLIMSFTVTLLNVIKVYGFNARTRAFNGILATLTLWTIAFTITDYGHALSYMPLLGALGAMQLTLWFRIAAKSRSYIGVLLTIALLLFVFVCNTIGLTF